MQTGNQASGVKKRLLFANFTASPKKKKQFKKGGCTDQHGRPPAGEAEAKAEVEAPSEEPPQEVHKRKLEDILGEHEDLSEYAEQFCKHFKTTEGLFGVLKKRPEWFDDFCNSLDVPIVSRLDLVEAVEALEAVKPLVHGSTEGEPSSKRAKKEESV